MTIHLITFHIERKTVKDTNGSLSPSALRTQALKESRSIKTDNKLKQANKNGNAKSKTYGSSIVS